MRERDEPRKRPFDAFEFRDILGNLQARLYPSGAAVNEVLKGGWCVWVLVIVGDDVILFVVFRIGFVRWSYLWWFLCLSICL